MNTTTNLEIEDENFKLEWKGDTIRICTKTGCKFRIKGLDLPQVRTAEYPTMVDVRILPCDPVVPLEIIERPRQIPLTLLMDQIGQYEKEHGKIWVAVFKENPAGVNPIDKTRNEVSGL